MSAQLIAAQPEATACHEQRRAARVHLKIDGAIMHVIGALDGPAFVDTRDFPGFTRRQIAMGLTVPAVKESE